MEARGRLVQDVDVALLGPVRGELEALPLATGQRRQRLAEDEVAEPDISEPLEDRARGRRASLALSLALLAGGDDARHHREIGVDDARAVADRTGTLRVGAEERGLDSVWLGEGGANRVEQPHVCRRVASLRAADRALVDRHHAFTGGDRLVHR